MSTEVPTRPNPFPGESDPELGELWLREHKRRRRRNGEPVIEVCTCCGELPCSAY